MSKLRADKAAAGVGFKVSTCSSGADEGRKVGVYEYRKAKGATHFEKVYIGSGMFHQFGCDHEEFENCAGNYSTAIVEMPDGSVKNVPVELIVFNN